MPDASPTDVLLEQLQQALGDDLTIERELGGGGMSRVFVAHDRTLDRRVVVKVFPEALAEGLSADRFRREIALSAALQHPNIVPVISGGDAGGLPYFVMPFVEGESLRQRVTRGPMLVPEVVAILRDVGRALAYAHARGIVHRDIKPDNILLTGGAAVVADFGVAKALGESRGSRTDGKTLTSVGVSLGTPTYMAPEQAVADPNANQQVDLYAVGVMAWEMLTGRPPFAGESISAVMTAHLTQPPQPVHEVRPGVPAALATLVHQCLEKEPARRPAGAEGLLKALEDPAVVSGAVPSLPSIPAQGAPARARPALRWIVAAAVVVALGVVGWLARGARGAAPEERPMIAVLPLELASSDTGDAYLAQGIADEVTGALARIPGVGVASRLAARALARAADPAAAAREAGVNLTLEGSVQRRGDRVRVAAQLARVRDGATVWSQSYDRPEGELFALQAEIAASVAAIIRADVARSQGTPARRDPQAYDDYLRGHYLLARRVPSAIREAITRFEGALARDSTLAPAWAELAQAYAVLPLYTGGGTEYADRAVSAAQRAIGLDSTLAPAHAALGYLRNGQWQWDEGRTALERAVALDSTDATAWQWLGENLLLTGRASEAMRAFERAVRAEGDAPIAASLQGVATALAGDLDGAVQQGRRVVDSHPGEAVPRYMLGTVLVYAGRYPEAISELREVRRLAPGLLAVEGTLGFALARSGDRAGAERALAVIRGGGAVPGLQPAMAKVYAGLDRTAEAMTALEAAAAARDGFFASEPLDSPIFAKVPRDARWAALLSRVGVGG